FALGAALIVVGSRFLVDSAQSLAAALGVPSIISGLSVVAIGTSLPELVTGVSAARKGVPDLSLGNIIGANVLNLYLIVGLSGMINPLTLDRFTQFYSYGWSPGPATSTAATACSCWRSMSSISPALSLFRCSVCCDAQLLNERRLRLSGLSRGGRAASISLTGGRQRNRWCETEPR
ncbi:MAG: hypothetical protein QF786_08585, partial [Vicinamibacterales bacterium]|nr:hypothetical protein [Vicinamibacterales bacterium]